MHTGKHVTLCSRGDGQCLFVPVTRFEFTEVSYWIHADGLSGSVSPSATLSAANSTVFDLGFPLNVNSCFSKFTAAVAKTSCALKS